MKQRITIEQLREITDEQKDRLREWWKPEASDSFTNGNAEVFYVGSTMRSPGKFITYGDDIPHGKEGLLPLLSIGHMIELIKSKEFTVNIHDEHGHFFYVSSSNRYSLNSDDLKEVYTQSVAELCDALWEAVKMVL